MQENHPLLKGLNPAQQEAVVHVEGPLLVLAGPGSGKTRVVTNRIAWLLEQGVRPNQIAALTFTNKAADEMKRRLEILAPQRWIRIGTFHKFCAFLLRQFAPYVGLEPNFTIYDTDESKKLLDLVLDKVSLPTGINTQKIASGISWAKNELILPDQYVAKNGSFLGQFVEKAYPDYQKGLRKGNAVDFDDLLLHTAVLLKENPEIRRQLDQQFRYILVDEYQDTNLAQYAIARALCVDYPHLAVTGDPDQSIYGWRGANIKNILDFEKDFESVKIIRLEQNYRSTQRILSAASHLIAHNVYRKDKGLFTENEEGEQVRLIRCFDQHEEADLIAREIAAEVKAGLRHPKEYAIFFRMNALSRNLEHALHRVGVPFQLVRGLEFYNRKEVKDIMAYLQLTANTRDTVSFVRVVNEPRRGLGKTTLGKILGYSELTGLSVLDSADELLQSPHVSGMSGKVKKALASFVQKIRRFSEEAAKGELTVESLLQMILFETKYKEQYSLNPDEEDQQRLENIDELLSAAREFDQIPLEEGENALEKFLEQAALVSDVDTWEEESDRVSLMTLHAAKGLEFPVVYIIAVEENILPHDRSLLDDWQIEEERRLFFVGITRAEEEVRISRVQYRDFRGQRSSAIFSRFLLELPQEEIQSYDSPSQIKGDCQNRISYFADSGPHSKSDQKNTFDDESAYCDPGPSYLESDIGIDYDVIDLEYDEDGNPLIPNKKKKTKAKQELLTSLTTGAELLAQLHEKRK